MTAPVKGTILVVDDEPYVRESLAAILGRRGYAVRTAGAAAEALAGGRLDGVDAVLTDLKMAGEDGLALLRSVLERDPTLPVVVLTGHGSVSSAVECMKAGAFEYLLKPVNPEELLLVLERAAGQAGLRRELEYLRADGRADRRRPGPLGVSAGWREVVRLVEIAAPTDSTVLLLGETGSGKEEAARLLHARSRRAAGPFVAVNCAAVPTELFESEFFGHRRGAFTGATSDREGRFRVAHRGTLLMDEIDALPPLAQAKILRVIEDGAFERLGDAQPTVVDVRLVCASNIDLGAAVEAGRFRADLYYRIHVMPIHIPPLRERREDVLVLAEAFLAELASRLGKPVRGIRPDARSALEAYAWPGNVRELRNVIERAVLLEPGTELSLASLPADVVRGGDGGKRPAESATGEGLHLRSGLAREERRLLEEALRRSGGVRREAARLLGVDERNLAYFLKKHGLMRWRRG